MKIKISWSSWLVLLAIVGVIAAIAIPSYGDYIHRAQASEAVSPLVGAKEPLAEYFDSRKNWTCKPGTMQPKNLPTACRN